MSDGFTLFSRKPRASKPVHSESDDSEDDSVRSSRVVTAAAPQRSASTTRVALDGTWSSLGLSAWICNTCATMGMYKPTEVQTVVIPEILRGRDVIACSQTGSGKVMRTVCWATP
jgi:superfamily II DNA/RNA helicase